MSEVVTTPLSPGAGRSQDLYWPDPWTFFTGQYIIRSRIGPTLDNATTANTGLGGGTAETIGCYLGVDCNQSGCTAGGAGNRHAFTGVGALHIRTTKGFAPPYQCDDMGFMRVIATLASPNVPADGRDFGMQVTWQGGGIFRDGLGGFGFNINGAGALEFVVRGPNGLIRTVVPGIDPTKWHAYEFRIQSATVNDATLTALIDNVPIALSATSSSWAAGTDLPPAATFGGNKAGFAVVINSDGAVNGNLMIPFAGVRIQFAPSSWAIL